MEPDLRRHTPSPSASSSRPTRRSSASSTPSTSRPTPLAQTEIRQSEQKAPISHSLFQTPNPGASSVSLPLLTSHAPTDTPEIDDSRQPEQNQSRQRVEQQQQEHEHEQHLRDSGIDTSTSTNRTSNRRSQSMPNLPQLLMPPGEDRPDLWQSEQEPPTFRPRMRSRDAAIDAQDAAAGQPFVVHLNDDVRDPPRQQQQGVRRVATFLGYGTNNRYRKELIGLLWNLGFGFIQVRTTFTSYFCQDSNHVSGTQIAITLALIIYSGVHHSPEQPSISEWTACDKPLGIWSCFWIAKVLLDCGMTYWSWRRDWKGPHRRQNRPEGDAEQGGAVPANGADAGVGTNAAPGGRIPDDLAPVDTNLDPPAIGAVERQRLRIDASSPHYRLYSRYVSVCLSLGRRIAQRDMLSVVQALVALVTNHNSMVPYCKHPHLLFPSYLPA